MSVIASLDAARRLASVEGAKQMEMATWDFADALVADVPADEDRRVSSSHVKDDSRQALRLLAEQLTRAGFDYSVSTLRQNRATALAWPEETRVHKGATFACHRELRGHEDRAAVLSKLIAQYGGRVTRKQVRTWKQEQNPPAFRSWSDLQKDHINALIKRAAPGSSGAKEELAALLMAAARELLDEQ